MNDATLAQVEKQLTEIGSSWSEVRATPGRIEQAEKSLREIENNVRGLRTDMDNVRRLHLADERDTRQPGQMSIRGAELLGAALIQHLNAKGLLRSPEFLGSRAEAKVKEAADLVQRWTGQTSTEFPQPSTYSGAIDALIPDYGVARRVATFWPLSGGTDKPPRHKTGMSFGFISASALFTEKNPAFEFASLESHKAGGVVITPRELFEQSIVDIGMYLGLLAAKEFARVEDDAFFLGDGGSSYDNSVTGVCATAAAKSCVTTMSSGKTSPSDLTADNCRKALSFLNAAAIGRASAFLHSSMRAYLPELNTQANQYVYREAPGVELLLGRPIIWTDVLQAYSDSATVSKYIVIFGDLSWFWLARRPGTPRIDTSADVLFTNDQIATRFINEIDVDYRAGDAAGVVKTAAS